MKRTRQPRQTPRQILGDMLAVCERNGWTVTLEALRDLLTRWEKSGGDD